MGSADPAMTKWQTVFQKRQQQCCCYDCLRDRGITAPSAPDALGLMRDPSDGRFTLHLEHVEKTKKGVTIDVVDQRRYKVK
jgi:hypothetical protein